MGSLLGRLGLDMAKEYLKLYPKASLLEVRSAFLGENNCPPAFDSHLRDIHTLQTLKESNLSLLTGVSLAYKSNTVAPSKFKYFH